MGGRGKGGSWGNTPIPMSSMAYGRKDAPPSIVAPPEFYPTVFFKPQQLHQTEEDQIIASKKEQIRREIISSRFCLKTKEKKAQIERYSDKYEMLNRKRELEQLSMQKWNYQLFPNELRPKLKAKKDLIGINEGDNFDEIKRKLDKLEEKDDDTEDREEEGEEKEDGEEGDAFQEEEGEEENDYAISYFDNGEDYLNDSDDNLDKEATF